MNNDKRQFADRLLDASLERFSDVEPRAGLPGRILAGVAARHRVTQRRNWVLGFAVSALAVFAISIAVLIPSRTARRAAPPAPVAVARPENAAPPAPPVRERRQLVNVRRPSAFPKRPQQFPTPAPLSKQEKLLLLYVKEVPKSELATPLPTTDKDLEIPDLKTAALQIKDLARANELE
jgi:hypothetical protein